MLAVGMLAIWFGYSTGLWGWCLLRDYDVTMGQLVSPLHPYAGPWPPKHLAADVIWPGGRSAASGPPGQPGSKTTPAQAAHAGESAAQRITDILKLPGFGFVK